jgi:hypothetical protein
VPGRRFVDNDHMSMFHLAESRQAAGSRAGILCDTPAAANERGRIEG